MIQKDKLDETKTANKKSVVKKNKIFFVILAIVILVGTFAISMTNTSFRENVKRGLGISTESGDTVDVGTDLQSGDTKDIAIGDKAIISSAIITDRKTGTGPFDSDNEPGNDESETNDVVRSFDQISWTIEANMEINDSQYTELRGGTIYLGATLPEEFKGLMKWSSDKMTWAGDTGKVSEDGLTFTGQYSLSEDTITVPGKQTLSMTLDVLGAGNNTMINPTFKLWMEGNDTNKENEGYEVLEIQDNLGEVRVSAKGGYNIKIARNNYCTTKTSVDFGDGKGEVSGRMYGYGVILQLYGDNEEKGLKGIEAPKGDINFDINMKLEIEETIDGKTVTTDITEQAMPVLWN